MEYLNILICWNNIIDYTLQNPKIPNDRGLLIFKIPTIDLFQLSMQLGLKGMGKLWKKTGDVVKKVPDNLPTMGFSKARCSRILGVKITPPKAKNTDSDISALYERQKKSTGGKTPFDEIAPDGYRSGVEHIKANTRSINEASFTKENIEKVKNHLSKEEISNKGQLWAENKVMVERLKAIEQGKLEATDTDKAFLTHELRENELMNEGKSYKEAHAQACKEYGFDTYKEKGEPSPFYTQEANQAAIEEELKILKL